MHSVIKLPNITYNAIVFLFYLHIMYELKSGYQEDDYTKEGLKQIKMLRFRSTVIRYVMFSL